MAVPITWRNVAAPKVASVLQFSANQVDKGLGGLSNQLAGAASKMDSDELNNALNRIQQLNQVGQAQQAQEAGFIEGLGLSTPQQQMAAREALNTQIQTNRSGLRADQQFSDDTFRRDDVSTQNTIDEQRAAGDYEGANATADILNFGSGTTKLALGKEKKSEDILSANESFDQEITAAEIGRNKGLQQNNQVSENVLSQMPEALRNEVSLDEDGQLVFSDRIGAKPQEAILNAIKSAGGYQDVAGYADIRQNAIANASPLVGAARIQEGQDQISGLQSKDPIYRQQAQQKLAMDTYKKGISELNLQEVLDMNNIPPQTPIGGEADVTDLAKEYLDLAITEDSWAEFGKGDYKQVVDASMNALGLAEQVLGRSVNMDSLRRAMAKAPEVLEAQASGGNLGDWWGDEIDPQKLADLIVAEDQRWFERFSAARSNIRDAKTKQLEENLNLQAQPIL